MSDTHPLRKLLEKPTQRVVGLMSGTSLDGIDAVLCEISTGDAPRVKLQAFHTAPYSPEDRARLEGLFTANANQICQGSFWLGGLFADAALAVIRKAGCTPSEIDLIGSHGQTIWHQPPSQCGPGETPSTLQIGEPAVIAARTGAVTVADFRVADVALGGEGAPLVPFSDWLLYRVPGRRRALQNIGGIANVTYVSDDRATLKAFDNGPGNMMLDVLAARASNGSSDCDRDGQLSARGRVQDDLLGALLTDPYLKMSPPKSTGRERYGRAAVTAWAEKHRDRSPFDLLATSVAFTAHAIVDSYRNFLPPVDEVLVSGGGAHNRTLMHHLAKLLSPVPVRAFGVEDGLSPDAKEAVAFALFATMAVFGTPANVPAVTGASRNAVLGKICLPPLGFV